MQWDIIHEWNDIFEISDETEDELEYIGLMQKSPPIF